MFICYAGIPGSGKSYEAVLRIIENLKKGRTIYTNIDGMGDQDCREEIKILTDLDDYEISQRLIYISGSEITTAYKTAKSGSFIVIDECHELMNARNWQSQQNADFSKWGATHRHQGYDCLLLTQSVDKIDSHVRSLLQYTYEFEKADYFGRLSGNAYIRRAFRNVPSGKPIKNKPGFYDKKIFPCYRSYSSEDVKELGFMDRMNILKHPVFLALPVVFLIAFYLLFYKSSFASGDLFGVNKIKVKAAAIKSQSQPLYAGAMSDKIKAMGQNQKPSGPGGGLAPVSGQGFIPSNSIPSKFPESTGVEVIRNSSMPQFAVPFSPPVLTNNEKPLYLVPSGKQDCTSQGYISNGDRKIELFDCGKYLEYRVVKDSGKP